MSIYASLKSRSIGLPRRRYPIAVGAHQCTVSYIGCSCRARLDPSASASMSCSGAAATDPLDNTSYYHFDAVGNRTILIDARANASYFLYDAADQQTAATDPLARTTYFAYDAGGNLAAQTNPRGYATTFGYDALGRGTRVTDAGDNTTYFDFDVVSNQISVLNARGYASYFEYDDGDRLTRTLDPLNHATDYAYDANGNRTAVTDALGYTTYFEFDELDRQTDVIDPLDNEASAGYDSVGNVTWQQDPEGHVTYLTWDAANRNAVVQDPMAGKTYFHYDANANRTALVDAEGHPTYFEFDELDRQAKATDALGNDTRAEYDPNSNLISILNPLGAAAYFEYDAVGGLTRSVDRLGLATEFGHDEVGSRIWTLDAAGHATYYAYDDLSRLASATDALRQTRYYAYDANSSLVSSEAPWAETTYYTYDAADRRTGVLYPDASARYYDYDAVSNMVAASDARGWTYFSYDPLGRVTGEKPAWESENEVTHDYDRAGWRIRLGSPAGWPYYVYDAGSRMSRIENMGGTYGESSYGTPGGFGATYYEYNRVGGATQKTLANGCYAYFAYDAAGRQAAIQQCLPDALPLADFEYEYDAASRITCVCREDGNVVYYTYDDEDRLTSEQWTTAAGGAIYAFEWEYDAVGNRTYERRESQERYYEYDSANELTHVHDLPDETWTYFAYDSRGNCTRMDESGGSTYFEYSDANLVTSIRYKDGTPNYFYYDGLLRRYAIEDSCGLAYFTWDANGMNLLAERDVCDNVRAGYTHGHTPIDGIGSVAAARKDVSGTTYYQYPVMDHRGTVVRLVDETDAVTAYYEHDAWGVPLREDELRDVGNRFRYQTNWLSLGHSSGSALVSPTRWYQAYLGRFGQRDELSPEGSYGYSDASPSNLVDPEGLWPLHPMGAMMTPYRRTLPPPRREPEWSSSPNTEFSVGKRRADISGGETAWKASGQGHTDIYRTRRTEGTVSDRKIRTGGYGGTDQPSDAQLFKGLIKTDDGSLRWGHWKDTPCCKATSDMIADCLEQAPKQQSGLPKWGRTCQHDVQHAIEGCCLRGYWAFAGDPVEEAYMTDDELRKANTPQAKLELRYREKAGEGDRKFRKKTGYCGRSPCSMELLK